jgi:preprotein translocase SecE subunit
MSKVVDSFKSFGNFLRECRVETGKISWPGRRELVGSVWVVAGLILALSAFVCVCDWTLSQVMTYLTRLG